MLTQPLPWIMQFDEHVYGFVTLTELTHLVQSVRDLLYEEVTCLIPILYILSVNISTYSFFYLVLP